MSTFELKDERELLEGDTIQVSWASGATLQGVVQRSYRDWRVKGSEISVYSLLRDASATVTVTRDDRPLPDEPGTLFKAKIYEDTVSDQYLKIFVLYGDDSLMYVTADLGETNTWLSPGDIDTSTIILATDIEWEIDHE